MRIGLVTTIGARNMFYLFYISLEMLSKMSF